MILFLVRRKLPQGFGRWLSVGLCNLIICLPHFHSIPNPQLWARYGIKSLADIMPSGVLLPFSRLSKMFSPPTSDAVQIFPAKTHGPGCSFCNHLSSRQVVAGPARSGKNIICPFFGAFLCVNSPKIEKLWVT